MNNTDSVLNYEICINGVANISPIKQLTDHTVKEIKSKAGPEADIQICIDTEVKDKKLYTVTFNVLGMLQPIAIKKQGKHIIHLIKKVRRIVLRKINEQKREKLSIYRRGYRRSSAFSL